MKQGDQAAVCEFHGGLNRPEAEKMAYRELAKLIERGEA